MRTGEKLAQETARLASSESQSSTAQSPHGLGAVSNEPEVCFNNWGLAESLPLPGNAHQLRPDDYSTRLHRLLAYEQCGWFNEARTMIVELLVSGNDLKRSEEGELRRILGDLDEKTKDPLAAEHEYERASQIDASEPNYFAWGAELLLHGAAAPAVEVFGKGVRLHPSSVRMLAGLSAAHYLSGATEEAAKKSCEASDLDPTNSMPYLFLGKMQESSSYALPCAEARLARYARAHPDDSIANYYYGLAIWKRERGTQDSARLQLAETLFRKACDLDRTLEAACVELGNLYLSREQPQQAITAYDKALASNPYSSGAHHGLGVAYRRIGRNDRAESETQQYELLERLEAAALERRRSELGQFLFYLNNQPAGSSATSNSAPGEAK